MVWAKYSLTWTHWDSGNIRYQPASRNPSCQRRNPNGRKSYNVAAYLNTGTSTSGLHDPHTGLWSIYHIGTIVGYGVGLHFFYSFGP